MTYSRRFNLVVFAVLLVSNTVLAHVAHPQPAPDSVITAQDVQVIARFEDATSLAIDPSGRLYVTDGGADAVVQLSSDGTVQARYGGPGTQPGTFDDPADLDPTNGLALYVADAGNARVQRFARSFQFLEAIPVGRSSGAAANPTYDRQDAGGFSDGTGRPIAVAVSDADELFVVDAAENHVVHWGPRRREPRAIGGFEAGPGALREPVALALGPDDRLFVADRGHNAIVVFDSFGNFLTTIAEGLADDANALRIIDGTLWLIGAESVQMLDLRGRIGRRWSVQLGAPLVDAGCHAGQTYLLVSNQLYLGSRPGLVC